MDAKEYLVKGEGDRDRACVPKSRMGVDIKAFKDRATSKTSEIGLSGLHRTFT